MLDEKENEFTWVFLFPSLLYRRYDAGGVVRIDCFRSDYLPWFERHACADDVRGSLESLEETDFRWLLRNRDAGIRLHDVDSVLDDCHCDAPGINKKIKS